MTWSHFAIEVTTDDLANRASYFRNVLRGSTMTGCCHQMHAPMCTLASTVVLGGELIWIDTTQISPRRTQIGTRLSATGEADEFRNDLHARETRRKEFCLVHHCFSLAKSGTRRRRRSEQGSRKDTNDYKQRARHRDILRRLQVPIPHRCAMGLSLLDRIGSVSVL